MTPVLLHGHGLALWISAICSLKGEDNGMAILWQNGIHSVDNSAPPLNTCGAKGGFLLLEYSLFTKGSAEVQSYRKLQGGSFFWDLSGLNWVTHYIKFLPWYSIHVFFLEHGQIRLWSGCVSWLWPGCVCCLSVYSNGGTELWKTLHLAEFILWKKEKWGNLLWIHFSRASGSWSPLLLCLSRVSYFSVYS